MKHSVFRGFLLGCLAMLVTAFALSAPASASIAEPLVQVYELRIHDDGTFAMVETVAIVDRHADAVAPGARSSVGTGPLNPVYALSHRTAGHSLDTAYHLRL